MEFNYLALLGCGIAALAIGSVWYGPLFGNKWMAVSGKSKEELESGSMPVILGLAFVFSCLYGFGLAFITNHQYGVMQLFAMHPDFQQTGTEINSLYGTVMSHFGDTHRSFGHGAIHGGIFAIMSALPLIVVNALFERRGWTYILIHVGYWLVTSVILGGIVCQFL